MKLDKEIILERYGRCEDSMAAYRQLAGEWESMYKLDPGFSKTQKEMIAEGKEQVVLPVPFNVINLSQRLLSNKPRINVMTGDLMNKDSVEHAEQKEQFLSAYWKRICYDLHRNPLADANWYNLVRGRHAFDVRWIKKALPRMLQKTMLPITVRALDPVNVGYWHNGTYMEWVYVTEETSLLEVLRKWPELRDGKPDSVVADLIDRVDRRTGNGEDVDVTVVDFWYVSEEDGSIWNAVLVEDEFAKEPARTLYPALPIVVGRGDYAPGLGQEWEGLSILHPLRGLWQYQCRLASQMATGLLYHFWPAIIVENENGAIVEDIQVGPGLTTNVPPGTRVTTLTSEPNVPLANAVFAQIEAISQQSSYPDVMYGQAPGSLQAGYGVSLLSDAARGRIKNYAESMELSVSHVNKLILALIEEMAGKEGVSIFTMDDKDEERRVLTLTPDMIDGMYENEVTITPNLPSDDQARVTLGLRLAQEKKISDQTLRDKFLDVAVPTNEQERITFEEAMQSDEMRLYRIRKAMENYFGDEAYKMLIDTPFMPKAPEGYQWVQKISDGPVTLENVQQQQAPPQAQQMDVGMEGQMPIQAEGIQGPMGGNMIAPAQAGILEPEMLGMPANGDPALFAEMTGQPLPPGEELNMAGGLPQ
jgi:hypothetical protein